MKTKIYTAVVVVVGVLTLVACGNQKNQRIPLKRAPINKAQVLDRAKFTKELGCLDLEAVAAYYKSLPATQLARLSVRDVSIRDKEAKPELIANILKSRPLEIQVGQASEFSQAFPVKVVKQTDCESVQIVNENGDVSTLEILKPGDVRANRSTRRRPAAQQRQAPRQQTVNNTNRRRTPINSNTPVAPTPRNEYSATTLLLQDTNGEKWIYQFNYQTKSLEVRVFQNLNVKNCPDMANIRIQEVYDLVLLEEKPTPVKISNDVLAAVKALGIQYPEKTSQQNKSSNKKKTQAPEQVNVKRNNQNLVTEKTFSLLSTDLYSYLAMQIFSDKTKAPACDSGGN